MLMERYIAVIILIKNGDMKLIMPCFREKISSALVTLMKNCLEGLWL